jgi:SAM-dependent methyltransferase
MSDVIGEAIADYYHGNSKHKLWIHNKYGKKEEMPVETYFRDAEEMTELELTAVEMCKGAVLDIGAGAGSISLLLQESGIDVTALEISPKATAIVKHRSVQKVLNEDIFTFDSRAYDTLLLLMNGIGLCGTIDKLRSFLRHAKTLMSRGGQLLFDSSDVAYLYKNKQRPENYYGEIMYQYEYKKQRTEWFSWLYIDQELLSKIAAEEEWATQIILEDEYGQFLARLTMRT